MKKKWQVAYNPYLKLSHTQNITRVKHTHFSPIDLVSGAEALLVPLRSLCVLQGLLEGALIRQQPAQGAGGAVASSGGCGSSGSGGPGGPATAPAEPEAESCPLP